MAEKIKSLAIYFAGAIRGGRDDAEWYGKFVTFLGQYGVVLTEHVGNDVLLREEQQLSEQEIFRRDMDWLDQADVVIAEVTTPSLGVGYELGVAQYSGKKILCLFRPQGDQGLSAMVAGNEFFEVHQYHDFGEACELMRTFLGEV